MNTGFHFTWITLRNRISELFTKCMFNSLRKCWILSHSGCTILRTHHNAGELNAPFSRSVILSISWVLAHEKTFSHQLEMNYSSCYKNRVNANSFHLIINFRVQSFTAVISSGSKGGFLFPLSVSLFLFRTMDLVIFIYSIL